MLFEIGSSRKRLNVTWESLVHKVEEELKVMGDVALLPFGGDFPGGTKEYYILQWWSEKWNCFVDITACEGVGPGDRLTVVSAPKCSSSSSVSRELIYHVLRAAKQIDLLCICSHNIIYNYHHPIG